MINKYEKVVLPNGEESDEVILRTTDNSFIPCNPANSDYQAYLRWLENPDADEAQSL